MRRFVITALATCLIHFSFAQKDSNVVTQYAKKSNERMSNDHLMLQLGHTIWLGKPDSINTKGWTRSFAAYAMMDFPFKTNTHWSVGLGPGISAENQFFDKMIVDIKSTANAIPFINVQDTTHFKKFKDCEREIGEFYLACEEGLMEKLGCVLFQLPPQIQYSEEKLEHIIGCLHHGFKNVIEFRHKSWWKQKVYDANDSKRQTTKYRHQDRFYQPVFRSDLSDRRHIRHIRGYLKIRNSLK